jgi:hypothetical protein
MGDSPWKMNGKNEKQATFLQTSCFESNFVPGQAAQMPALQAER